VFRQKRADTTIGSIEAAHGICLNARSDMKLGSLLKQRGFDSLSQLLRAARGRQFTHPCKRGVFLSFHCEDLPQVNGFRLMMRNRHLALEISDDPNRYPVNSERSTYIKRALRQRIKCVDVVVCLIGNGTAWRDWVDWEIATALEEGRGVCGIRLKGARSRAPSILHEVGASIASWDVPSMTAAIERAAALRS
jgi:MTH538 TIR-like domain (DUF1863)